MAKELETPEDFREIPHLKKRAFLASFASQGTVGHAAASAGISRRTHDLWMHKDEAYAVAFERAKRAAGDALEHEARRRAFRGSDTLLIFLLKAADPARFNDRLHLQHSGPAGAPLPAPTVNVTVNMGDLVKQLGDLKDDDLRVLELLAARRIAGQPAATPTGNSDGQGPAQPA